MFTPYLLRKVQLGDGKDINRLTMPQGMLTPSIIEIRGTHFSDFRVDFIPDISSYMNSTRVDEGRKS